MDIPASTKVPAAAVCANCRIRRPPGQAYSAVRDLRGSCLRRKSVPISWTHRPPAGSDLRRLIWRVSGGNHVRRDPDWAFEDAVARVFRAPAPHRVENDDLAHRTRLPDDIDGRPY